MKYQGILVTAVWLVFAAQSVLAQSSTDDQEIRAIVKGFSDIWARADIKAFERLLTEDAGWVVRLHSLLNSHKHESVEV